MSYLYGEPQEESVYDLIPQQYQQSTKSARHRSKFGVLPPTGSTFGAATSAQVGVTNLAGNFELVQKYSYVDKGRSFGPKKLHLSDTRKFLRKHTGVTAIKLNKKKPKKTSAHAHSKRTPIAPFNTTKSAPRVKKDYISQNALITITKNPRSKPSQRNQSSDRLFMTRANYGKVPDYLNTIKQEIAQEKTLVATAMQQRRVAQARSQPKMRQLSEGERSELLNTLKDKWAHVNKQYQNMTHIVTLDTFGKIKRKEQHELQLTLLEKNIEKLSRPVVYVQND